MISRAIYPEIREGRGVNGSNYVYLDVRPETVNKYAAMDGRTNPDGTPIRHDRRADPGETAGHHRFLPRLPGCGPGHADDAHPAHGALHHGRHPDQQVWRGGDRRREHTLPRSLRGGRVRLRLCPRREPARHEFPARPGGVRQACRAARRGISQNTQFRDTADGPDCLRPGTVRPLRRVRSRRTSSISAAR